MESVCRLLICGPLFSVQWKTSCTNLQVEIRSMPRSSGPSLFYKFCVLAQWEHDYQFHRHTLIKNNSSIHCFTACIYIKSDIKLRIFHDDTLFLQRKQSLGTLICGTRIWVLLSTLDSSPDLNSRRAHVRVRFLPAAILCTWDLHILIDVKAWTVLNALMHKCLYFYTSV